MGRLAWYSAISSAYQNTLRPIWTERGNSPLHMRSQIWEYERGTIDRSSFLERSRLRRGLRLLRVIRGDGEDDRGTGSPCRCASTEAQNETRPPTDAGCVSSKTFVFLASTGGAPRGSESRALSDLPGPMEYGEPYSLLQAHLWAVTYADTGPSRVKARATDPD
jgi:hypothetical protein